MLLYIVLYNKCVVYSNITMWYGSVDIEFSVYSPRTMLLFAPWCMSQFQMISV